MKFLLACLICLAAATAICANQPKQASIPATFTNWQIAYVRDGSIWIANADGTGQRLVVKGAGAPCWAPDRRKLAYYQSGNIWISYTHKVYALPRRLASQQPTSASPAHQDVHQWLAITVPHFAFSIFQSP